MRILIVEFILEALVVVVAGHFLVRYADRLEQRLGLGRSIAGVLLLATATSLPELLVGAPAAYRGAIDLAMGNLLGSSLFNLLTLAVLDLLTHTRGRLLAHSTFEPALAAMSSLLLTTVVLLFLVLDVPWSVGRLDVASFAIALAYVLSLRLIYLDQRYEHDTNETAAAHDAEPSDPTSPPLRQTVLGYLAAALAIVIAAPLLAKTSDQLATATGLGGTLFGTLFVAFVTGLPEVSTTFAALRMRAVNMAIGNILGSNAFNMVMLIGVDLAYAGPLLASVRDLHAVTAACVMLITCVFTQGLLYRREKRYWIVEPDALLMILLVVAAFCLVYALGITI